MEPAFENLQSHIEMGSVELFNANPAFPVSYALVQKNDEAFYILSEEGDPQLLLNIPFRQPVKLHHLSFRANLDGNSYSDSAPLTVKIFVNRPNMSFSEAESAVPAQILTLRDQDFSSGVTLLKFVKFQNVSRITVFIEDNRGGDCTRLNGLEFFGSAIQDTNMSNLQSSG